MQRAALTVATMMKRRRTQTRKTIRAWRCLVSALEGLAWLTHGVVGGGGVVRESRSHATPFDFLNELLFFADTMKSAWLGARSRRLCLPMFDTGGIVVRVLWCGVVYCGVLWCGALCPSSVRCHSTRSCNARRSAGPSEEDHDCTHTHAIRPCHPAR